MEDEIVKYLGSINTDDGKKMEEDENNNQTWKNSNESIANS